MNGWTGCLLGLAVGAAVALPASPARGQDDASTVNALIRDLKNPDFDTAYRAAEELRKYPQYRAQVVAGLIDAVATGNWSRCGGDMREAIAGSLGELKAKEAVIPLLEVAKSDKSIEHECAE